MLDCKLPVHVMHSGTYFLLANVDTPIHVQIQLFGVVSIDPVTGKTKGAFTKAWRNRRRLPLLPRLRRDHRLPHPPRTARVRDPLHPRRLGRRVRLRPQPRPDDRLLVRLPAARSTSTP